MLDRILSAQPQPPVGVLDGRLAEGPPGSPASLAAMAAPLVEAEPAAAATLVEAAPNAAPTPDARLRAARPTGGSSTAPARAAARPPGTRSSAAPAAGQPARVAARAALPTAPAQMPEAGSGLGDAPAKGEVAADDAPPDAAGPGGALDVRGPGGALDADGSDGTPEAGVGSGVADPGVAGPGEAELAPDLTGYDAYERTPLGGAPPDRDELVNRYAHLVKYVVGRLGVSVPGLFDHEDAMQAGVLGLLRAIDAYRPDAAASFESYAILRIRGSILDAVRSLDSVGRAGREAARAIQGAIRDLQHELGRTPSEVEVAERLGLSVTRYRERLQAASVVTVSLDERDSRDGDEDQAVLADCAADPNAVDPAEEATRKDAIASLVHEISRLSTRAKTVLGLYYQDEMTFKEIGQVLGVTESRVCQIHTEAILVLRGRLVEPDLAARLGRRRARS